MDAIEKRARELVMAEIPDLANECFGYQRMTVVNLHVVMRILRAALTPPEGYVLVPVEVQKDADRFRFLASWAGAEFNSERGYLRWYLSRKGRGFATLAETVDQCLPAARPEVP
ncbi:hypothetical protein ABM187_003580 [Stenotrophomonas maltophilia]